MKKILVPVDFSGHSEMSCRYALEFARVYGGEIRLFHTYFDQIMIADTSLPDTLDLSAIYNEGLIMEIARQSEAQMKELKENLEDLIQSEKIGGVTVTSQVTGGEIEHELKGVCTEFMPDLVVTGATGKGKTHKIWGQVASFIIDHAKVPVITIPETDHCLGFHDIMFTADLSECNEGMIHKLVTLLTVFAARIHVVHFVLHAEQSDAWVRMGALESKFADSAYRNNLSFEVIEVAVDNQAAIDRFIVANNISMIAFQPHKHSFLYMMFTKNITRKNLFATNVPLLSLPVCR